MIEEQVTENNQLQTNLAIEVLEQFMNLKARISVGIIYLDLQRGLGDTKLAVDKFERSSDSRVCPYLTELIKKAMFYYELAFQCTGVCPDLSTIGSTGKAVAMYFPDLPVCIKITRTSGFYDGTTIINACLVEVQKLTDELYEILHKPVDLSTLTDIEKITALPKQREANKYNSSFAKNMTGITAIFLGGFGMHKFSLGYTKEGLIMLGVSLFTGGYGTGIVMIIGIVEGVIYLSKSNREFDRIYIVKKRGWF